MNDVNLAEYLPPFLREYKELRAVTDAENPEFSLLRDAAERVLKNEFIETADEFGISRFEKLLGILPSKDDTLESRRARVYSRWFTELPYTLKMFVERLAAMSGGTEFSVTEDYEHRRVAVETRFELYGQTDELERLVELMFPCNIIADLRNTVTVKSERRLFAGGAAAITELIFIEREGV